VRGLSRGLDDGQQHSVHLLQHLIVPEAQHAKAESLESSISDLIVFAVGVLAAIDLNDKEVLQAGEVCDVRANRMLSPESQTL
jgi:hypothetical protein